MIATSRLGDLGPFSLAGYADCMSPDGIDSPGAHFLIQVRDDVEEALGLSADGETVSDDIAHDIADSAVPIYTHERWLVFVDLGAYQEDASELGADTSDLSGAAGVALYMIAERLVTALVALAAERREDDQ